MNPTFYLPRKFTVIDRCLTESELLATAKCIVILAEPGAGKTRVVQSLAAELGTKEQTASRFVHSSNRPDGLALVIDGYDEIAKVGQSSIHRLLAAVEACHPPKVIIAARSSEWDDVANAALREYFPDEQVSARLVPFVESEQQQIFANHVPNESFDRFKDELVRFDFVPLLSNPEFLKLLAKAYVESDRCFRDRRSIFEKGLEGLARQLRPGGEHSVNEKLAVASQVFATLLLAGAEGVSVTASTEDVLYPSMRSLIRNHGSDATVLATQLFIPGDCEGRHSPVHKIVAEFAAAKYLVDRIDDPDDFMTLDRCLPVIAPNGTVRDDLRGLLGWMASLGSGSIQAAAIKLDAYAVLANGDPSQLDLTSKHMLFGQLKTLQEHDPFFRRADSWRKFNIVGLFTEEIVELIRPLLVESGKGHLRQLILQLLYETPATALLINDLQALVQSSSESLDIRSLALRCLLAKGQVFDPTDDLADLTRQGSVDSLELAAQILGSMENFANVHGELLKFFQACASLLNKQISSYSEYFHKYFIWSVLSQLTEPTLCALLDSLASDLPCNCGADRYRCNCRNGKSKIVGMLLDRYFHIVPGPHQPETIWRWVKDLNFHHGKAASDSKAVEVLRADRQLKTGIMELAFGQLTDRSEIDRMYTQHFRWNCHSGLTFLSEDHSFMVDFAFDAVNPVLWGAFLAGHKVHRPRNERGPDPLRARMRRQARDNPVFMREWVRANQEHETLADQNHVSFRCRSRRRRKSQPELEQDRQAAAAYLSENREYVESGQDWDVLKHFAMCRLFDLDEKYLIDEELMSNMFLNCLALIEPKIPALTEIAIDRNNDSSTIGAVAVFYAACAERLKQYGSLAGVSTQLLRVLKTCGPYVGVPAEQHQALVSEVNRLAFAEPNAAERFCRDYIEPQLESPGCLHPNVSMLRSDPTFDRCSGALAFEWLNRFEQIPIDALELLFEIAVEHSSPNDMKPLICRQCDAALNAISTESSQVDVDARRKFWCVRAFHFLDGTDNAHCEWLKQDPTNVMLFELTSGVWHSSERPNWPALTAVKVEAVLDAYYPHWPKVDLPNHYSNTDPIEQRAYRLLSAIVSTIGRDTPEHAIPVLERMLSNPLYADLHMRCKSIRATQLRMLALRDFEPPRVSEIWDMLHRDAVITVEALRARVVREFKRYQSEINGGEFNQVRHFYTDLEQKKKSVRSEPARLSLRN